MTRNPIFILKGSMPMDNLLYALDADALARQATLLTIAQALALAGAIAAAILFINPKRRGAWRGFWRKVADHVNFERFLLSSILKFLYVFAVLSAFIYGIVQLFTGAFLGGLLMMIAAPLGLRVLFELLMLLMSIREEAGETNALLRRMQGLPPKNPPAAEQPAKPAKGDAQQSRMQPDPRFASQSSANARGGARQGRMQPDPRYTQQSPVYPPPTNGFNGYTAQPRVQPQPQAQPQAQPYTDFSPSQRYAPVRPNGYAAPEATQPQPAAATAVRPTPADGTGRFTAVPMRDKPE
jgi:hypothetical protein